MSTSKKLRPSLRHSYHGPAQRDKFKLSAVDKLYMAVATVESFVITGLVVTAFLILEIRAGVSIPQVRGSALYLSTFILSSIFSLIYAYDALRAHNVVQLVFHLLFELFLLAWGSVEVYQTKVAVTGLDRPGACIFRNGKWDCVGPGTMYSLMLKVLVVVPPVILAAMLVFTFVAHKLYEQFGWEVYRMVNADLAMKKMHRNYETFMSLIKLLFFFALNFCMLYLIVIPLMWRRTFELVITVIALPVLYPTLFLMVWALKKEHTVLMLFGLVILCVGEVYFAYKMTTLFTLDLYATCRYTLAIFSAFAIVLTAATIIYGVICIFHFGRGLRVAQETANQESKGKWRGSLKDDEAELELRNKTPFLVDA